MNKSTNMLEAAIKGPSTTGRGTKNKGQSIRPTEKKWGKTFTDGFKAKWL